MPGQPPGWRHGTASAPPPGLAIEFCANPRLPWVRCIGMCAPACAPGWHAPCPPARPRSPVRRARPPCANLVAPPLRRPSLSPNVGAVLNGSSLLTSTQHTQHTQSAHLWYLHADPGNQEVYRTDTLEPYLPIHSPSSVGIPIMRAFPPHSGPSTLPRRSCPPAAAPCWRAHQRSTASLPFPIIPFGTLNPKP